MSDVIRAVTSGAASFVRGAVSVVVGADGRDDRASEELPPDSAGRTIEFLIVAPPVNDGTEVGVVGEVLLGTEWNPELMQPGTCITPGADHLCVWRTPPRPLSGKRGDPRPGLAGFKLIRKGRYGEPRWWPEGTHNNIPIDLVPTQDGANITAVIFCQDWQSRHLAPANDVYGNAVLALLQHLSRGGGGLSTTLSLVANIHARAELRSRAQAFRDGVNAVLARFRANSASAAIAVLIVRGAYLAGLSNAGEAAHLATFLDAIPAAGSTLDPETGLQLQDGIRQLVHLCWREPTTYPVLNYLFCVERPTYLPEFAAAVHGRRTEALKPEVAMSFASGIVCNPDVWHRLGNTMWQMLEVAGPRMPNVQSLCTLYASILAGSGSDSSPQLAAFQEDCKQQLHRLLGPEPMVTYQTVTSTCGDAFLNVLEADLQRRTRDRIPLDAAVMQWLWTEYAAVFVTEAWAARLIALDPQVLAYEALLPMFSAPDAAPFRLDALLRWLQSKRASVKQLIDLTALIVEMLPGVRAIQEQLLNAFLQLAGVSGEAAVVAEVLSRAAGEQLGQGPGNRLPMSVQEKLLAAFARSVPRALNSHAHLGDAVRKLSQRGIQAGMEPFVLSLTQQWVAVAGGLPALVLDHLLNTAHTTFWQTVLAIPVPLLCGEGPLADAPEIQAVRQCVQTLNENIRNKRLPMTVIVSVERARQAFVDPQLRATFASQLEKCNQFTEQCQQLQQLLQQEHFHLVDRASVHTTNQQLQEWQRAVTARQPVQSIIDGSLWRSCPFGASQILRNIAIRFGSVQGSYVFGSLCKLHVPTAAGVAEAKTEGPTAVPDGDDEDAGDDDGHEVGNDQSIPPAAVPAMPPIPPVALAGAGNGSRVVAPPVLPAQTAADVAAAVEQQLQPVFDAFSIACAQHTSVGLDDVALPVIAQYWGDFRTNRDLTGLDWRQELQTLQRFQEQFGGRAVPVARVCEHSRELLNTLQVMGLLCSKIQFLDALLALPNLLLQQSEAVQARNAGLLAAFQQLKGLLEQLQSTAQLLDLPLSTVHDCFRTACDTGHGIHQSFQSLRSGELPAWADALSALVQHHVIIDFLRRQSASRFQLTSLVESVDDDNSMLDVRTVEAASALQRFLAPVLTPEAQARLNSKDALTRVIEALLSSGSNLLSMQERIAQVAAGLRELEDAVARIRDRQVQTRRHLEQIHTSGNVSWQVQFPPDFSAPSCTLRVTSADGLQLENEKVEEHIGLAQMLLHSIDRRAEQNEPLDSDTLVRSRIEVVVPVLQQSIRIRQLVLQLATSGCPSFQTTHCTPAFPRPRITQLNEFAQQLAALQACWNEQLIRAREQFYALNLVPARMIQQLNLCLHNGLRTLSDCNRQELVCALQCVFQAATVTQLLAQQPILCPTLPSDEGEFAIMLEAVGTWLHNNLTPASLLPVMSFAPSFMSRERLAVAVPNARPWLIEVPSPLDISATLLTMFCGLGYLPSTLEILFCNADTTMEQVLLLLSRAWHQKAPTPRRVHYLVGVERLSMPVLDALSNALRSQHEVAFHGHPVHFFLVLIAGVPQHPVLAATVKQVPGLCTDAVNLASPATLKTCVATELTRLRGVAAGRHIVRAVLSTKAGQGKSLYIRQSAHQLGDPHPIIMPIGGPMTRHSLVQRLRAADFSTTAKRPARIVHFDLSPTELEDLNLLLLELLVTGSLPLFGGSALRAWLPHGWSLFVEVANTLAERFRQQLVLASFFPSFDTPLEGGLASFQKPETDDVPILIALGALDLLANGTLGARKVSVIEAHQHGAAVSAERCRQVLAPYVADETLQTITSFLLLTASNMIPFLNASLLVPEPDLIDAATRQALAISVVQLSATFVRPPRVVPAAAHAAQQADAEAQALVHHVQETMKDWREQVMLMFDAPAGSERLHISCGPGLLADSEGSLVPVYSRLADVPRILRDTIARISQFHLAPALREPAEWTPVELLGYLFQLRGSHSGQVDMSFLGDYALTPDNFVKMCLILQRIRAALPVVLMGESGCGKTELLTQLARIMAVRLRDDDRFFVLPIDAGTAEQEVVTWLADKNAIAQELQVAADRNVKAAVDERARNSRVAEDPAEIEWRSKDLLRRWAPQVWVFLDEINTSRLLPLFKEIICDRRLHGQALSPNLRVMAACNPYRLRESRFNAGITTGLTVRNVNTTREEDIMTRLVYRVLPLPERLLQSVFNFGSIDPAEETRYMRAMIQQLLGRMDDSVLGCLRESHQFIRDNDPNTPISLRDVSRYLQLHRWFQTHQMARLHPSLWGRLREFAGYGLNAFARATILAAGHVYQMRLGSAEARKAYAAAIGRVLGVSVRDFTHVLLAEQESYLQAMRLEPDIARNRALRENVFMMLVCIVNRIPVFVTGKPGCSKTLAMTLVVRHLRNDRNNEFFSKLPTVSLTTYQGSRQSTAAGIKKVFDRAIDFQLRERTTQQRQGIADASMLAVAVVLLDEIGLAEISPHNPCKVLHALLQPQDDDHRIGVVGISNWRLDNAKMNRACHMSCLPLDEDDLLQTAKSIADKEGQDIGAMHRISEESWRRLVRLFSDYLQLRERARVDEEFPAHGLREFYYLVKFITHKVAADSRQPWQLHLLEGLLRNFGGLSEETCRVGPRGTSYPRSMPELLTHFLGTEALAHMHNVQRNVKVPLSQYLMSENLRDPLARHLMLVSRSIEETLAVLDHAQVLQSISQSAGGPLVLLGSDFVDDDDNDHYASRMLNQVVAAMGVGRPVIMWNLDALHEALMDMLNQRYEKPHADGLPVCHVALGGMAKPACPVDPKFKFVLIVDDTQLAGIPAPLATRFEKQVAQFEDFLNPEQRTAVRQLEDYVKAMLAVAPQAGTLITCLPEFRQAGRLRDDDAVQLRKSLSSLVLSVAKHTRRATAQEIVEHAQTLLLANTTLECMVGIRQHFQHGDVDGALLWVQYSQMQAHLSLTAHLAELMKQPVEAHSHRDELGTRSIVYTFSGYASADSIQRDVSRWARSAPADVQVVPLASVHSEAGLMELLSTFWESSAKSALVFLCDPHEAQGLDRLERITLTKIRIDETRQQFLASCKAKGVKLPVKHVVLALQMRRSASGEVQCLGCRRYIPVTASWAQTTIDDLADSAPFGLNKLKLMESPLASLLASDAEEQHSDSKGEAAALDSHSAVKVFNALIKSVALRTISKLEYYRSDRLIQSHINDFEAALEWAPFMQRLQQVCTTQFEQETDGEWQTVICSRSDILATATSFQTALIEYVRERLSQAIVPVVWKLESHGLMAALATAAKKPAPVSEALWKIWEKHSTKVRPFEADERQGCARIMPHPRLCVPFSGTFLARAAEVARGLFESVHGRSSATDVASSTREFIHGSEWADYVEQALDACQDLLADDALSFFVHAHWLQAWSDFGATDHDPELMNQIARHLLPMLWQQDSVLDVFGVIAVMVVHNRLLRAVVSCMFLCQALAPLDRVLGWVSATHGSSVVGFLVRSYCAAAVQQIATAGSDDWIQAAALCERCLLNVLQSDAKDRMERGEPGDLVSPQQLSPGMQEWFGNQDVPADVHDAAEQLVRLRLLISRASALSTVTTGRLHTDPIVQAVVDAADVSNVGFANRISEAVLQVATIDSAGSLLHFLNTSLAQWCGPHCSSALSDALAQQEVWLAPGSATLTASNAVLLVRRLARDVFESHRDTAAVLQEGVVRRQRWDMEVQRNQPLAALHASFPALSARSRRVPEMTALGLDSPVLVLLADVFGSHPAVAAAQPEPEFIQSALQMLSDARCPSILRVFAVAVLRAMCKVLATNLIERVANGSSEEVLTRYARCYAVLQAASEASEAVEGLLEHTPNSIGAVLVYLLKQIRQLKGDQAVIVYCEGADDGEDPRCFPLTCLTDLRFAHGFDSILGFDPFISPNIAAPSEDIAISQQLFSLLSRPREFVATCTREFASARDRRSKFRVCALRLGLWDVCCAHFYLARSADSWSPQQEHATRLVADTALHAAVGSPRFMDALVYLCSNRAPTGSVLRLDTRSSAEQVQRVSVIVHSLGVALAFDEDVGCLSALVGTPGRCTELFLPCMPEDEAAERQRALAAVAAAGGATSRWQCQCGLQYFVGECGRPMEVARCTGCGNQIGGTNHNPTGNVTQQAELAPRAAGAQAIRGYHYEAPGAADRLLRKVRAMNRAAYRCLRIIMHSALFAAHQIPGHEVQQLLRTIPRMPDGLGELLNDDWDVLQRLADSNQADVCAALHYVLHNLRHQLLHAGATQQATLRQFSLTSDELRAAWEQAFTTAVAEPVLSNVGAAAVEFVRVSQAAYNDADTAGDDAAAAGPAAGPAAGAAGTGAAPVAVRQVQSVNDLVNEEWSCSEDMRYAWLPHMFRLQQPAQRVVTMDQLQQAFARDLDRAEDPEHAWPFLQCLLSDETLADIDRVCHLYPIIEWIRTVSQLATDADREHACAVTLEDWMSRQDRADELQLKFERFMNGWNAVRGAITAFDCQQWTVPAMSSKVALAFCLPRRDGNDREQAVCPQDCFPPGKRKLEFVMNPGRHILLLLTDRHSGLLPEHNRLLQALRAAGHKVGRWWMRSDVNASVEPTRSTSQPTSHVAVQADADGGVAEAKHGAEGEGQTDGPARTQPESLRAHTLDRVMQSDLLAVDPQMIIDTAGYFTQAEMQPSGSSNGTGFAIHWADLEQRLVGAVLSSAAPIFTMISDVHMPGDARKTYIEQVKRCIPQTALNTAQQAVVGGRLASSDEAKAQMLRGTETLMRLLVQTGGAPTTAVGDYLRFSRTLVESDLQVFQDTEGGGTNALSRLQLQHVVGLYEMIEDQLADQLMERVIPKFRVANDDWPRGVYDAMVAAAKALWNGPDVEVKADDGTGLSVREEMLKTLQRVLVRFLSSAEHGGTYQQDRSLLELLQSSWELLTDLPEDVDVDFALPDTVLPRELTLEHACGTYRYHVQLRREIQEAREAARLASIGQTPLAGSRAAARRQRAAGGGRLFS